MCAYVYVCPCPSFLLPLQVMGATNLPAQLDEAALRRFTKRVYIPLPDDGARGGILTHMLQKTKSSINAREMKEIVQATDGYSSSDLAGLTRDAAMGPIRELGSRIQR